MKEGGDRCVMGRVRDFRGGGAGREVREREWRCRVAYRATVVDGSRHTRGDALGLTLSSREGERGLGFVIERFGVRGEVGRGRGGWVQLKHSRDDEVEFVVVGEVANNAVRDARRFVRLFVDVSGGLKAAAADRRGGG